MRATLSTGLIVKDETLPVKVSAFSVMRIFCSNALADTFSGMKFAARLAWFLMWYLSPLVMIFAEISFCAYLLFQMLSFFGSVHAKDATIAFSIISALIEFIFHVVVFIDPIETDKGIQEFAQKFYQRFPFFKDKAVVPVYTLLLIWGAIGFKENVQQRFIEAKKLAQITE